MATKKPWELEYSPTTVEQAQGAPAALATQGQRPWEQLYAPPPAQQRQGGETQRLRSFAQGLTLGSADEIEAYLRGLTGEEREAALADIRSRLQQYRTERPGESMLYELGGAAVPSIGISAATGGTGLTAIAPSLARIPAAGRVAIGGGATGGATAFFTGEGGAMDRARNVPVGTTIGAIAGPAAYYGVRGGGALLDGVMDFTRRTMGGRGAKAVETEIQRLAQESGLTTDEIVQRVARGEIMAENETLRAAVRGYYTQGGQAAQTIAGAMTTRPDALRRQFMTQLQEGMTAGTPGNVLRQVRMDEDAIRTAERAMYGQAFRQGGVVTEPLLQSFGDALKSSPDAAKEIGKFYRAQSRGKQPFFNVEEDGSVEFLRTPTIEDMEIVRRGLSQEADKAFRSGAGATGGVLRDLERELRSLLDTAAPAVGAARTTAAQTRSAKDAFTSGRTALGKRPDEVALEFEGMSKAQVRAFRAGVMDNLRAAAARGGKDKLVRDIADPESAAGQILRTVFPGDQLDTMLDLAGIAARSRQAATTIMGGSPTAANLAQQGRIGSNVSAEEWWQFGTNPVSTIRTTSKIIQQLTPNLTETQRNRVAQILISEDPALVRNALTDNSLMAQLQSRVGQVVQGLASGAAGAAAYAPPARAQ